MEHEQELSLTEVLRIAPDAAVRAAEEGITSFWVNEPLSGCTENTVTVDGIQWDLMGVHGDIDDEDLPPWQWCQEDDSWVDTSRY